MCANRYYQRAQSGRFFRAHHMELRPVTLEKYEEVISAYLAGRCDALSADTRPWRRSVQCNLFAEEHLLLPERISKEPLAPAVRQGDDQWFDIVKWSQFAMIEAEERGVSSK